MYAQTILQHIKHARKRAPGYSLAWCQRRVALYFSTTQQMRRAKRSKPSQDLYGDHTLQYTHAKPAQWQHSELPPEDPCDQLIGRYVEQQVRDCVEQIKRGQLRPRQALRQVTRRLARELSQEQFLQLIYRFHSYAETPAVVLLLDSLTSALAERQQELKQEQTCHKQAADIYVTHYDQYQADGNQPQQPEAWNCTAA